MEIVSYTVISATTRNTYISAVTLSTHANTEYTKNTLSENPDLWGILDTNNIVK